MRIEKRNDSYIKNRAIYDIIIMLDTFPVELNKTQKHFFWYHKLLMIAKYSFTTK